MRSLNWIEPNLIARLLVPFRSPHSPLWRLVCVGLLSWSVVLHAAPPGNVTYTYDEAGRLKSAAYQNGYNRSYALDAAGNRTQVVTALAAPGIPGTPTLSNIAATTATATWTAAGGLVVSYEYSLNNGTSWTNVGNVLTTGMSGLTSGTAYVVQVHAVNTIGAGIASSASFTTLPGAPGTPVISALYATTATATWAAATGIVASYEYSLDSGTTWVNVGSALTVNVTGLGVATAYTIKVRARNASGAGTASSASFTTHGTYTDSPVLTIGTNSTGRDTGFDLTQGFGSMSPPTTSNNLTYASLLDHDASQQAGGGWLSAIFKVQGFTADPGAGFLVSVQTAGGTVHTGASAGYGYSNGVATWSWTTSPIVGGSGVCTIIHN